MAEVGRRGLVIPLGPFRARLGGADALRKVLGALTIVEKVHRGRPGGMAPAVRRGYEILRERGAEHLRLPRAKAAFFLKMRLAGGAPLLDGVCAAADALPEPRRIAPEQCEIDSPLYDYQESAAAYLCGPGGALAEADPAACRGVAYLQMDTGLGKSRVGLRVIAWLGYAALVVVPTQAIADQWVDEAAEAYPAMAAAVYHNPPKGSKAEPPGPLTHDVVVIIVNTFRDKGPDFMEGYGTVVLDEAHEYQSPCNSRALWLSQTRAVLGISATPADRADGLDRYVPLHLGPAILPKTIPGFNAAAVNFRGEVRLVEYAGHPDHCAALTSPDGTMSAIRTIGNVIADAARLRLVAAEVDRLWRLHETTTDPVELARLGLGPRPAADATPGHPAGEIRRHGVFVFAEHREYLIALRGALLERVPSAAVYAPELDGVPAADNDPQADGAPRDPGAPAPAAEELKVISVLRGGATKADMQRTRQAGAHIVLTTYGFSRRGISLPDMTALVKATPRRNGSRQIQGRILRRGSDESILRQTVDIVDICNGLKGQLAERRKVYKEKGYPVSKVKVSWTDYPPVEEAGVQPAAPAGPAALDEADEPGADGADGLAELTLDDLMAMVYGEA